MNTSMNLLGLNIEYGQSQAGLRESVAYLLKEFAPFARYHGAIEAAHGAGAWKIHRESDLRERLDLAPYFHAYQKITELLNLDQPLINWGGDHSVGVATAGAFLDNHHDGYVLWIDAHADVNLPAASPSGNFHGMPVSVLMNLTDVQWNFPWMKQTLRPERLIYLGLRDVDPFEEDVLKILGIRHYRYADVQLRGMNSIASEILRVTMGHPLHVSFDIDSVDPREAPATGLHVPGGLTSRDLSALTFTLARHPLITSLDVVEINPRLGSPEDVRRTYALALKFMNELFQQGGSHDRTRRTNQENYAIALESRL